MLCSNCKNNVSPTGGRCPECDTLLVPDDAADLDAGGTVIADFDQEDTGTFLDFDSGDGTVMLQESATLISGEAAPSAPGTRQGGPLEPGQQFGERYLIVELLGLGGMGAVYKAWDSELEIVVAIKVIRPEAAAEPEMAAELDRRFKRELLLAREVTHRNVVRIHDLGEIEGIKYITMSYVDGEDLATILKHQHTLSIPEALRITRDVVSGLMAAHEAGVVHRDLKPANIMLSKATGEAIIMDFGIARSAGGPQATPEGGVEPSEAQLKQASPAETRVGAVVGTFEYMAPEQLKGVAVDQRADLYTMGLILYDMLLGQPRVKSAHSAVSEAHNRSKEAPPPISKANPDVPEPLDSVISRCLEPDPENRYQTTEELGDELERLDDAGNLKPVKRLLTGRLVATAAAVVLALLAGTWWLAKSRAPGEAPEPMSILIADFDNRTGDPTFNGAVEQALGIAMEGAGFISSYPRPNAQKLAGQIQEGASLDEDMARLISRREGLDVVLVGTIEPSRSGFKVSVQAVDAALEEDGGQPLAQASERASTREDVLSAVGTLASDLRRRLGDTAPASARLAEAETFTTASLDAMSSYARGQDLAVQGKFEEALAAYQEAVNFDPEFGRAYAGMGTIHGNLRQQDQAEESYQKALQHTDRMSERERYRTLGTYYLLVARNYEKAIENYELLVELYPADGGGHSNLALAYLNARDFDKAVVQGREAVELDPNNIIKRINYAMYAMYAGEFEISMEESRKVMEQNPSFGYGHFTLARSAAAVGDLETASGAYGELASKEIIGSELAPIGQADLSMYLGRSEEARAILDSALNPEEEGPVAAAKWVALGEAHQVLGNQAEAARAAQRAIELSQQESVLYPAARVLLAVGEIESAEKIALDLENMLQSQTAAYAKLIEGEIALNNNRLLPALEAVREGWQRHDSWFAHYLLGRVYFEAEHFPEALGEFELSLERIGEVTDLFIVDGATLRYMPPVYYYLARVQEELGNPEAARLNYQRYLELRSETDHPDPLASDASARWTDLGKREATSS